MGLTDAAVIGSQIAGGLASVGNAHNSHAEDQSQSVSDSWGSSASSSYNVSDSWGYSDSWSDSVGKSDAQSTSWGQNGSQTYGSEASARDFEYAQEANKLQASLWREQADYNAKQAQLDRDFQERMANTAYQRAVKDLKAAGLNPILAVQGMGAATPVGAMASSGLASAYKANSTADQTSYGSSGSSAWSRSRERSHSESHSKNGSHSEGGSSSYSSEGSHSESSSSGFSDTTTQLASALGAAGKAIGAAGSAIQANNDKQAKGGGQLGVSLSGVSKWANKNGGTAKQKTTAEKNQSAGGRHGVGFKTKVK